MKQDYDFTIKGKIKAENAFDAKKNLYIKLQRIHLKNINIIIDNIVFCNNCGKDIRMNWSGIHDVYVLKPNGDYLCEKCSTDKKKSEGNIKMLQNFEGAEKTVFYHILPYMHPTIYNLHPQNNSQNTMVRKEEKIFPSIFSSHLFSSSFSNHPHIIIKKEYF